MLRVDTDDMQAIRLKIKFCVNTAAAPPKPVLAYSCKGVYNRRKDILEEMP